MTSAPAIPPLPHELMGQRVRGFKQAIAEAVARMRRAGWNETDVLAPEAVLERAQFLSFFESHMKQLVRAGADPSWVLQNMELLQVHAFYAISYELHRRKTFWIDESLAFMLVHTRLDVRGEGLRLPFPSFALVFTDPETLAAAETVVAADPEVNTMNGKRLRSLTAYVTQIPTSRGAIGLQLCLLFDAGTQDWPWIVTRDLDVGADDVLEDILDSRFPDSRNADQFFASSELRQLVQLVINATLYATSSPSWDVIGSAIAKIQRRARSGDDKKKRAAKQRASALRSTHSGEDVWHLPGKIPISHVRTLRDLQRGEDGGALFARFMVRGHWRRAPTTWADQRSRWIEPYWKGPELAAIVEKEYRLKSASEEPAMKIDDAEPVGRPDDQA
jgi:hypothetical protein